jgi:hypothetical protein
MVCQRQDRVVVSDQGWFEECEVHEVVSMQAQTAPVTSRCELLQGQQELSQQQGATAGRPV